MQKSDTIEKILAIITVIAWIIVWGAWFALEGWSPKWGYVGSPARLAWEYAYTIGACLPWGLYWMYKFSRHPEWLTPPGRYVKGAKVKVLSPYTITSIAIFGAIFCVAGLGDLIRVDLQALSVAAASAYFGSIVAFCGLWIGQIIARTWFVPWVAGGAAGFLDIAGWTTMDASIWAYSGYIFFRFYHGKPEWPRWKRLLVVMLLTEPVHQLWWFFRYWFVAPYEAAIAGIIADWTTYWNISWILVLIGYIIGASAYEARVRAVKAE